MVLTLGCQKEDLYHCSDNIGVYSYSDYPIGVAINMNELDNNPIYASIATKQFNSISPENSFKAENIHPEQQLYDWTEADRLVAYSQKENKRIHGHTLIWHNQLPQWILDFQGSSSDWELLMKDHIQTVMKHFKNKVTAWDVVNEAFNEDGTLRNSIWLQKIGNSYIEKAFLYASDADPSALLFYNDYNLESNPIKLNSVLSLMNNLRNRGINIDGIGVQMHINTSIPDPSQIAGTFQKIANQDYKIHVSELDISVNPLGEAIVANPSIFKEQAQILGSIVLHYNQVPKQLQYGITFWGVSDKNSWIRSHYNRMDFPLLYDDNYLPKPCYCTLINTL